MRILFVLEHFHPYIGGVEHLFYNLGKSLVKNGFDITVVTTKFEEDLAQFEEVEGIKIHRINCKNRFLFPLLSLPLLFKLAKQVDFIHTSTYTAALPAYITGLFRRKKTIITFHEYWGKLWNKLPFLSFIERNIFRFFEYFISRLPFHAVIAVSDATKASIAQSGVPQKRLRRIYNGIDYQKIENLKNDILSTEKGNEKQGQQFTFVGRLGVSKGIDLLIPAANEVLKRFPDAQFKMIIPKVPKTIYFKIQGMIEGMTQKAQVIQYHNLPKKDLYKEIIYSDFLVIPSYSEGFCFLAAETQALGIPIVTSYNTALKEVVGGKNIKLQNLDSESLTKALELGLQKDWDQNKSVKFTLDDSINAYMELYKELINGK